MSFSRLQMIFVFLLFIGISNHVLILPYLLSAAKRDAWVSVVFAYVILILWGYLLYLIMKKNKEGLKLFTWIKICTHRKISNVVISIFLIYILTIGIISFYDLFQTVNIYFLPQTPSWVTMLPFLVICAWSASSGFKSIVYVSMLLLPAVWFFGHFVAIFTMQEKDYGYIFPILTDGYAPAFQGVLIILGGGADLLVLLLVQHHLNKNFTFLHIIILITLLTGLILGPTLGSLSSFGPVIAGSMRFPAFEQWRLLTLGQHISHVDFFAVFQLLAGEIIRISLCIYIFSDIFEAPSKKLRRSLIIIFSIILGLVTIIPISDIWIQNIMSKVYYTSSIIFGIVLTLFLLFISFLPVRKGAKVYET